MDSPVPFHRQVAPTAPRAGIWCNLADPVAAEICAGAGYDWMLIDAEHAPNDVRTILAQLQAVAPYPTTPIVRPPVGDAAVLKRLLDVGARTVLVPMVDTAEQAAGLARAVSYPPDGVRGVAAQTRAGRWGRTPGYLHGARDGISLIVQIETAAGLANAEEIAAVAGVDAVFVGPADLAAALGHLGEPGHPVVERAIDRVRAVATRAGKPAGILTADRAAARRYLASGFSFVGVGIDTHLLAGALDALRAEITPSPAG